MVIPFTNALAICHLSSVICHSTPVPSPSEQPPPQPTATPPRPRAGDQFVPPKLGSLRAPLTPIETVEFDSSSLRLPFLGRDSKGRNQETAKPRLDTKDQTKNTANQPDAIARVPPDKKPTKPKAPVPT